MGWMRYDCSMRRKASDAVLISLFCALTVVGAFVKIPIPHIPLTLQTLIVMLAGLVLGSRRGALSQILYVVLGLIGLPIFAQGGGPAYILQPSFGFLLGFCAGAYVIGTIVEMGSKLTISRTFMALIAGQAVIYLLGISYFYLNVNFILNKPMSFSTVLKIGLLVFLPGDILKTAIAALVVMPIRQRFSAFSTISN